MPFSAWTHVLWQSFLVALPISLFFTTLLMFSIRHSKNHPPTGTVIGKTKRMKQKRQFFILEIEDKKHQIHRITTSDAKWENAQFGDTFTPDTKNGDWYWLSY